jgi:cell division septation protein DedD
MKNFGLSELRLVAPRDGWPSHMATVTAVGAADLLEAALLFDTLEEAVSDLNFLYAATARPRFMNKDYVLTRDVAADYPRHLARVGGCAARQPAASSPAAQQPSSPAASSQQPSSPAASSQQPSSQQPAAAAASSCPTAIDPAAPAPQPQRL